MKVRVHSDRFNFGKDETEEAGVKDWDANRWQHAPDGSLLIFKLRDGTEEIRASYAAGVWAYVELVPE